MNGHVRTDWPIEISTAGGTAVTSPSVDVLSIRIGPRDENVLRRTCQRLADSVSSGYRVEDQLYAAQQLAHVNDPVAVPIHQTILNATESVDWILLEALRKIGTPEAQRVLQDMAASQSQERSELAWNALQRWNWLRR
jgi:hypothetical protein